jgi:hypothetical protein
MRKQSVGCVVLRERERERERERGLERERDFISVSAVEAERIILQSKKGDIRVGSKVYLACRVVLESASEWGNDDICLLLITTAK